MQIKIRNSEEFHRLLFALVNELVDAQIHFKLYQDLTVAKAEYAREFNQSWTFWSLTFQAHLDAVLVRLCKAYDQFDQPDSATVNLRNLLDTIAENLPFFDEPNFRERLKDNPFVDSLAEVPRRPDPQRLQDDVKSVSNSNPLVRKLTIWRSNFYAHRSREHALAAGEFAKKYPLLIADVEALLANGVAIVNRYSDLFIATHHSTDKVGRDDYRWLLKAARQTLDAHDAQVEEQIRRFTQGRQ
jgi:hypothetical protein